MVVKVRRGLRWLCPIFAGVLFGGVLVAPVLARASGGPAVATSTTSYTRAWSCMGRDFRPIQDSQPFGYWGAALIGAGYYQCDADLPHKARVTRVRFTVHDTATGGAVRGCALARITLAAANPGFTDILAGPLTTDISAGYAPGDVRLADTSIDFATIDRLNYAYYLQCVLSDNYPGLALWGADVTYTITAANG